MTDSTWFLAKEERCSQKQKFKLVKGWCTDVSYDKILVKFCPDQSKHDIFYLLKLAQIHEIQQK